MKTSLTGLFIVICTGFLPIQASSQVVLPPAGVVQHYKDQNKRIHSHAILQTTAQANGDTLFESNPSAVDTGVLQFSVVQRTMMSTGFPLGSALTKSANGQWQSLTADSLQLHWNFNLLPLQSWTVFQDSANQLNCSYLGTDTISHFSASLPIWKFKLSVVGQPWSWLNNKEIWLSNYGIIRCPDFHVFPYQKRELMLTGYDSPSAKKGIYFTQASFTPYAPGDTLAWRFWSLPYYPGNPVVYYLVHELDSLLSPTHSRQQWRTNTRRYELDEMGNIILDSSWADGRLYIDTLGYENGIIDYLVPHYGVVMVYDSLPIEQNPDVNTDRYYAYSYPGYALGYYLNQASGSLISSYSRTYFRGDWGFMHYYNKSVYRSSVGYLSDERTVTYQTRGNRRRGSPPPLAPTSPPANSVAQNELLAFPNPATSALTVNDLNMENNLVQVLIYNSQGHAVQQFESHFPLQFDLTGFATGVYSVRITGPAGYSKYARFIKINP